MKQEAEEERGGKDSGRWELPGPGEMPAHTHCGVHRSVTPTWDIKEPGPRAGA